MARFDVYKWRSEQYQKDYLENQILEQIIRETLNIHKNQPLNEGKFGDFFQTLKDKIKNSKAFGGLMAIVGKSKDASKAVTFGLQLKSLGILPKNEEQAQILKDTLEGKKTNLKEATEEKYKQKVEKAVEEDEKLFNWWNDTWVGVSLRNFFIFATIFNILGADVATTINTINPDVNIQTQVGITHANAGAIDVMLDDAGFDDPNQRADIMAGTGDVTIKNAYSHGGDIKIAIDDDGGVDIEGDEGPVELGALETDTSLVNDFQQQGGNISVSDNQTINFSLFDLGSSDLSEQGHTELETQNDVIIDYLLNGQNYSETITGHASNTGANSMFDNGTGEADKLPTNRANTVADYVLEDISETLNERDIQHTVEGNTITLEDGTTYTQNIDDNSEFDAESQLQQIDPTDETASQSATRTGHAEETPPDSGFTFVDFDPVAVVPKDTEVPEPEETDIKPPPPVKFEPGEFKEITTGIRESQFAMIFQLIAPDIPVFYYLNKMLGYGDENEFMGVGKYGQKDFENLKRSEDPEIPQEVKKLSGVLINLRKSPDAFIKKISDILRIELETRYPARHYVQGAQKGHGRAIPGQMGPNQGVNQPSDEYNPATVSVGGRELKEEIHPFEDLLINEAAVDEFIDERFVKNYAAEILMMLCSIYASNQGGNIAMSILNPEKLPDDVKRMVTTLGFKPITTGMEAGQYVFLGSGDYSLEVGDEPNQGVNQPSDEYNPATVSVGGKELTGKIVTTPKGVDEFSKDFTKSEFVKKAKEDGWMFVDRKNLNYLPKGTKVKPLSKRHITSRKYWGGEWVDYFNQKIFGKAFGWHIDKKGDLINKD